MATLSQAYAKCASKGQVCHINGNQSVAYVSDRPDNIIHYRNESHNVICNDANFGAIQGSYTPSCYVASVSDEIANPTDVFFDTNGNPAGWLKCADEGGFCNPGVPSDILYGARGSFVYANASSVPCNSATFGNHLPGIPKACYYRPSNQEFPSYPEEPNGDMFVPEQPNDQFAPPNPVGPDLPVPPNQPNPFPEQLEPNPSNPPFPPPGFGPQPEPSIPILQPIAPIIIPTKTSVFKKSWFWVLLGAIVLIPIAIAVAQALKRRNSPPLEVKVTPPSAPNLGRIIQ